MVIPTRVLRGAHAGSARHYPRHGLLDRHRDPAVPGCRTCRCACTTPPPAGPARHAPGATARMYVCGITPYDATHLGHAATYLAFDLVNRIWRDAGHDVHYVQNVTDIDDPLLERAARDGEDWVVLGMRETALFREDMEALRVLPPRRLHRCGRSDGEIVELVEQAARRGRRLPRRRRRVPDVYFDVAPPPSSSATNPATTSATMLRFFAERGGDPDRPGKRHPLDALLWRGAATGEPAWPSPRRRRAPGLAHRVRGDRPEPPRPAASTCRAAAAT